MFAYSNATLTVNARDIALATTVACDPSAETYDGEVKTPVLVVSDKPGDTELIKDSDWTAAWTPEEIKAAGTYTATLTGRGNYTGTIEAANVYTVMPRVVTIEWGNTNFTYTGAAQKPVATVSNAVEGDEVLATVEPDDAVECGEYVATVTALTGADAANYTLEGADVTTPFDITKSDVQKKLEEVIGVPPNTVTPERDAEGNVTNWVVTLNEDKTGVIDIPDNLGSFTLDLNDHTVKGTNGVDGTTTEPGTAGGPAFRFVPGEEPDHGVTQVAVGDGTGDNGSVAGGNGGAGNPPGAGGPAFAYAEGADAGAGYADPRGLVSDGRDGTALSVERIAIGEARSRSPWQAALDVTCLVSATNPPSFFDYRVVVAVSNADATAGTELVVPLAEGTRRIENGTNAVTVTFADLAATFGDAFAGDVTVRAALEAKPAGGVGYGTVAAADGVTAGVDCRTEKTLLLGGTMVFNVSSNEWDASAGGTPHVGWTRSPSGSGTLDPVADRERKAWSPAQDGTYAFEMTPGGDTAEIEVAYPANVTNSFPVDAFEVVWNAAQGRWEVTLGEDLTGPVMIADDLGAVRLDLDGHTIAGTNGVDGADGGDALVFTAMDPEGGVDRATDLTIVDSRPTPGEWGIRGGDGADGYVPGEGGAAIATNPPCRDVGVTVTGGASVRNGRRGETVEGYWAWCDSPGAGGAVLPAGVLREGDRLYFWKHDASGAAVFDFGELEVAGLRPSDDTIHFVDGEIAVAGLAVPAALDWDRLVFKGGEGTVLRTAADESIFTVYADGGNVRRFEGLGFAGHADDDVGPHDGGAIRMKGGVLEVADCAFDACHTKLSIGELGGAICALELTGDSLITNATFTGCWTGPRTDWGNGYGGAVYVSAATDGLMLSVRDSTFAENYAHNGGAICTRRRVEQDEAPMGLELDGDGFVSNRAHWNGGAVISEGEMTVTNALFSANTAGVEGGAICYGMSDEHRRSADLVVRAGSVFRGNAAVCDNAANWTCGGAVAVVDEGFGFVTEGRHVIFEGNRVRSGLFSYGGAVYLAPGSVADIALAGFLANTSEDGGGAVFATGADATVSTCIFSNNTVNLEYGGLGGAVSVEESTLVFSNCTVRGANGGAVDIYEADAQIVNCVIADNCGGTDISATTDEGGAATLAMSYTSYGTAEASETVTVTTNACRSGTGASVYRGTTLYLDSLTKYLPEAAEGLVQEAWDYDAVKYGSRPEGTSMGAYECPTSKKDPRIEIVSTEWYHNRGDGLYYPRITVRFLEGDATRITGLTLMCDGVDHELPESCVAELRTATPGQEFVFGVNPDKFPVSYSRTKRDGYIIWDDPAEKERVMLFGEYKAVRPLTLELEVKGTLRFSEVVPVKAAPRFLARSLPRTVAVPARFEEFGAGERITGKALTVAGARVWLYGSAALGCEWALVRELETDAEGRFETAIPVGLFFFRLEGGVSR